MAQVGFSKVGNGYFGRSGSFFESQPALKTCRSGSIQLQYVAADWDFGYVSVAGEARIGNPNRHANGPERKTEVGENKH